MFAIPAQLLSGDTPNAAITGRTFTRVSGTDYMFMDKFNAFSVEQYQQWSIESKGNPLPRREIDFDGKKVEVFALPGYKEKENRYIYSGTSASEMAGKDESSFRRFIRSKSVLALRHKGFEFVAFTVEKANKPIVGYYSILVADYWLYQVSKGNVSLLSVLSALTSTSLDLLADKEFGINRTTSEYERMIRDRLFTTEAVEYKIHFYPNYYNELYRIFQKKPSGKGRPAIFGRVTRDCFYSLFPGQANDLFDERNPDRLFKNHQFLSEDGNKIFAQVMNSFVTFLRACRPGNWDSFVVQYQNVYGSGFQGELEL